VAEKTTILCVDDEATALFLRKAVLEKFGFTVITAPSGKQALEILGSESIDLVLSDLLMPEMPGSELARAVKERFPELPVVVVSGVNEIPPEMGYADLFVSKLEGPVRLCERIREVLDRNRIEQQTS